MDQPEQIQLPAGLDQSEEGQITRVWRHDQFVGLGFDPPVPRSWRTTREST
jgi:hypothetical protein